MFLNTEEEIKNWLYENTNMRFSSFYLTKEDDQIVLNHNSSLFLNIQNKDIIELPIKFGKIDGNFYISNNNLESFKGFPSIINGTLDASGNSFKSTNDWNTKDIKDSINLCGSNCELDNLNFLNNNNKFTYVVIKITNTPFKDNIIPKEYENYMKKIDNHQFNINFNDFKTLMKLNTISENEINDYLDSFDNELKNEIK